MQDICKRPPPNAFYFMKSEKRKNCFKDTLKFFDNFKNKQLKCMKSFLWYIKVYILWRFIQYIKHWNKPQMLGIFPSKVMLRKNALFFLSGVLTHHSFTFNLQFLYGMQHKVHLAKSVRKMKWKLSIPSSFY